MYFNCRCCGRTCHIKLANLTEANTPDLCFDCWKMQAKLDETFESLPIIEGTLLPEDSDTKPMKQKPLSPDWASIKENYE